MAALAVFTFLFNWDNFLWPSVVLTSPQSKTLPLVLAGLRSLYLERYDMWSAGSMLTVAPVMLLYAVAQKQFIRGITMTGLKALGGRAEESRNWRPTGLKNSSIRSAAHSHRRGADRVGRNELCGTPWPR